MLAASFDVCFAGVNVFLNPIHVCGCECIVYVCSHLFLSASTGVGEPTRVVHE